MGNQELSKLETSHEMNISLPENFAEIKIGEDSAEKGECPKENKAEASIFEEGLFQLDSADTSHFYQQITKYSAA